MPIRGLCLRFYDSYQLTAWVLGHGSWASIASGLQRLGSPLDAGRREVNILYLERKMLKYAIIFAIVSLVAGALGFSGIAAGSAGIAKILFGLFLILAVVFIVLAALGVGAARKVLK